MSSMMMKFELSTMRLVMRKKCLAPSNVMFVTARLPQSARLKCAEVFSAPKTKNLAV
jgi:hypothetical protein